MNQPLSPAPSNRLTTPPAPAPLSFASVRRPPPSLAFREIGYGYLPGDSFGASIVAHILAVFVILVLNDGASPIRDLTGIRPQPTIRRHASVYLPIVGGGIGGRGEHSGSKGKIDKDSARLLAQNGRGFAYPGPQPIVSNPPQARLGTQTILRELKNLPRLQNELPLPNLVRPPLEVDEAQPNKSPVLKVRSGRRSHERRIERAIPALKILLPPTIQRIPDLAESKSVMPNMAKPEPVKSANPGVSRDQTGLLVLNAIPVPDAKTQIPLAERRSLFAVSPAEVTVIAEPAAGTKSEVQASQATGSASGAAVVRGDALAEAAANGSAANQPLGSTGGSGGGRSDVLDNQGFGPAVPGPGSGRDAKSAEGIGTGATPGTGSGAGAGSAPGTGAFRGITIQGGRYRNNGLLGAPPPPRRQTSYSMTIVSAGHGGGGLPDVGVFHNDKVYTVYLDMRANDDDRSPSWILQYALLQPPGANTEVNTRRIQGTPTPPYAMLKEIPAFPPEFFRNSPRPLIIASAIMTPSGNLESVSVVQSPAAEFIKPIVEALQHWMFEPARLDGQAVALKVLLGIRLAVP